jgi:hypothetical protein
VGREGRASEEVEGKLGLLKELVEEIDGEGGIG